jgi:hypothetical protein
MMQFVTISQMLIRVIFGVALAAAGAPVFSAEPVVIGVHARYKGTGEAVQKLYQGMAAHCEIIGPLSQLGIYVRDQYFMEADGSYLAEYTEGYGITSSTIGPGVCRYVIGPYKKINLYHFGTRKRYEYRERINRGPEWTTHSLPGEKSAIATGEVFDTKIGKAIPTGKTDIFAGIKCQYEEVRTPAGIFIEACVNSELVKANVRFPKQLILKHRTLDPKTGEQTMSTELVSIDFKAKLERSLFFPPAEVQKSSVVPRKRSEGMQKWCRKEFEKTGVDPCAKEPEGDDQ